MNPLDRVQRPRPPADPVPTSMAARGEPARCVEAGLVRVGPRVAVLAMCVSLWSRTVISRLLLSIRE